MKYYEGMEVGIEVHSEKVIMLTYASDISLLAENKQILEEDLADMSMTVQNYNIKINTSKTKRLLCIKTSSQQGVRLEDRKRS